MRARKMVSIGSGAEREVDDYQISRFACYLIAQNGDPRKPEIAAAQKCFAIQTRRQELSDQAAADLERLEMRKQTSEEFKALSGAARQAGVQSRMFGIFHDAGYKGLYGGLGVEAIGRRRGKREVRGAAAWEPRCAVTTRPFPIRLRNSLTGRNTGHYTTSVRH